MLSPPPPHLLIHNPALVVPRHFLSPEVQSRSPSCTLGTVSVCVGGKLDFKRREPGEGLGGRVADVRLKARVLQGGGGSRHRDNDRDSCPTDSPPAAFLSPCLRFGFGSGFELGQ